MGESRKKRDIRWLLIYPSNDSAEIFCNEDDIKDVLESEGDVEDPEDHSVLKVEVLEELDVEITQVIRKIRLRKKNGSPRTQED